MKVTLYFTQSSSDKVYVIEKIPVGDGFLIDYAYGARGSTLKVGSKTPLPLDEKKADQLFTKTYNQQVKDGYTTDISGVPHTPNLINLEDILRGGIVSANQSATAAAPSFTPSTDRQPTGIGVQLLNPVSEADLDRLFLDNNFIAQEKHDGERRGLILTSGEVYGSNRNGLKVAVPTCFVEMMKALADNEHNFREPLMRHLIIDGEAVGDVFYAFDLLEAGGVDYRNDSYEFRFERLKFFAREASKKQPLKNFVLVSYAKGEAQKRALFNRVKNQALEGVVFKNLYAAYQSGRPNSGGDQFKFKFYEDATCLVAGQNGDRRSIRLQILNSDGTLRDIGNCTVPANHNIPNAGDLVDISYLYAYREGSLYQPIYKGVRTDKTEPDQYISLKFKAQAAIAA